MEYPEAKPYVFYGGNEMQHIDGIEIWPIEKALRSLNLIVKQELSKSCFSRALRNPKTGV